MLTHRKMCTVYSRRATYAGKYSIISQKPASHRLPIPDSSHLVPMYTPWLITSAVLHCIPVTGTSSSSVPPAAFTDTLRHARTATEWNRWDGYQSRWFCSVILMHSQTQLMNTEVPAHADTLRGTGRSPRRQAHR